MKKILFLLLTSGFIVTASAQVPDSTLKDTTLKTDTTSTTITHKYYFYPSSNVYFDEATGNYWYLDSGTSQWLSAQTLPSTVTLVETPKYLLDYTGNEPWQNNAQDMKKYKVTKSGKVIMKNDDRKVKMKPKDNGNVKVKAKDKD